MEVADQEIIEIMWNEEIYRKIMIMAFIQEQLYQVIY